MFSIVQVFGYGDGTAEHLFERECSVQRRFQKIFEESRAPGLPPEVLARMTAAAIPWRIEPSGERLLAVAFDAGRDATALHAANRQACAAAARIGAAALPGVTDVVPALATVGIHYRPSAVSAAADTAPFQALSAALSVLLAEPLGASTASDRVVEIPVCYGGGHGPDLEEVAASRGLAPDAVITLHSAAPVDVLMLGFAPGHPYVGKFDARLAPPRRTTPRTAVPAGSIGLANCQSVIYPMVLPAAGT
jgi:KipI family sensor histidine kinase inhibitor|nr:carboxyltransferase domain-containing protein [Cupriavidus sp. KK10]